MTPLRGEEFLKDLSHERMLKTPLRILGMTALLVLASMYS
jgi:hypothetical protein